jgi:hypothetical protein
MCSCRKADLEKAPALCIELIEQSRGLSDSVYSIHCTTSLIAKLTSKNYSYVPPLILNVTFYSLYQRILPIHTPEILLDGKVANLV